MNDHEITLLQWYPIHQNSCLFNFRNETKRVNSLSLMTRITVDYTTMALEMCKGVSLVCEMRLPFLPRQDVT